MILLGNLHCVCVCVCVCVCLYVSVFVSVCVQLSLTYFILYTVLKLLFLSGNLGHLTWVRLQQPQEQRYTVLQVHAGSFHVSVFHQPLTWTTGSLTCVHDHSYACVYAQGLAHRQWVSRTFFAQKNSHKFFLCSWRGSNLRSLDLESDALPNELCTPSRDCMYYSFTVSYMYVYKYPHHLHGWGVFNSVKGVFRQKGRRGGKGKKTTLKVDWIPLITPVLPFKFKFKFKNALLSVKIKLKRKLVFALPHGFCPHSCPRSCHCVCPTCGTWTWATTSWSSCPAASASSSTCRRCWCSTTACAPCQTPSRALSSWRRCVMLTRGEIGRTPSQPRYQGDTQERRGNT